MIVKSLKVELFSTIGPVCLNVQAVNTKALNSLERMYWPLCNGLSIALTVENRVKVKSKGLNVIVYA